MECNILTLIIRKHVRKISEIFVVNDSFKQWRLPGMCITGDMSAIHDVHYNRFPLHFHYTRGDRAYNLVHTIVRL